jgi:quercetin dioxygenase-like cupin family protein
MDHGAYSLVPNVAELIPGGEGIVSKPFISNEHVRITLFAMAAGQELHEHTAAADAIIQVLEGSIHLTVQGDAHEVGAGAVLYMQPRVPHSLTARTDAKFSLTILRH